MRAPSTRRSFSISYTAWSARPRASCSSSSTTSRSTGRTGSPPGCRTMPTGSNSSTCRPRPAPGQALRARAQPGRIPQQRSQAGDGAPSHAKRQNCAQVQPDLLHAQPATLSRQGACLLPGPYRPLCRVISQCYIFAARVSKSKLIQLTQAGNLLLQPDRLGLGDIALFAIGSVERPQVTRDAGLDLFHPPGDL